MFREIEVPGESAPAANATDLFLCLTPSTTQGAKLEGRTSDGATATIDDSLTGPIPPYWLRLTRVGNLFTAYTSADGVSWTLLGSLTVNMATAAYVGLAVSSHSVGALNTSTFQNVSIVPTPYIVTPASATPAPVTGLTTNLSALANENGSGAGLSYNWAATSKPSGANPIFSINGANAAQNTTVTFNAAGNYTFQVTATDAANNSITSSVNVTVNQTLTSISVLPASANLTSGQSAQFSATALDQFGSPLLIQPTFTWSTDSGSVGDINAVGLYTSPINPVGAATVRATAGSTSGSAAVTINYLKGDINLDGHRDSLDLAALMSALSNLNNYQASNNLSSTGLLALADIDGDGRVTNADLQSLISLLANAAGSASSSSAVITSSLADAPIVTPAITSSEQSSAPLNPTLRVPPPQNAPSLAFNIFPQIDGPTALSFNTSTIHQFTTIDPADTLRPSILPLSPNHADTFFLNHSDERGSTQSATQSDEDADRDLLHWLNLSSLAIK